MIPVSRFLLCLRLCSSLSIPLLYAFTHKHSMSILEQTTDSLSFVMTCDCQRLTDQQVGWFLNGSIYGFQTSSYYEPTVNSVQYQTVKLR